MQIDGKEFVREIMVDANVCAYEVYFCADYISSAVLWRSSPTSAKQIGYLTCLNHPALDGTNPHWRLIIEINKADADRIRGVSIDRFVDALSAVTPLSAPIWAEIREVVSTKSKAIGGLWNDE